jgi:hypothetical protein
MTKPHDLDELAARAEKQDGAEWAETAELMEDVFRAVFPKPERIWVTDNNGDWTGEYTVWQANQSSYYELLEAQAFLDAAMTLVPEGWRMAALCERSPWFCRMETLDFDSVTWGKGSDWITDITAGQETTAKAATPALALTAACLRARASLTRSLGGG